MSEQRTPGVDERSLADRLIAKRRSERLTFQDVYQAVVEIARRLDELESRLDDMMEANGLWSGR